MAEAERNIAADNIVGMQFGKWVVRGRDPNTPGGIIIECACGYTKVDRLYHLKAGKTRSCRNCADYQAKRSFADKMIGKRHFKITVVGFHKKLPEKPKGGIFILLCDCGKKFKYYISQLTNAPRSCPACKWRIAPNATLTEDMVIALRSLHDTHLYSRSDLAHMFGISRSTVFAVTNHQTWKKVE